MSEIDINSLLDDDEEEPGTGSTRDNAAFAKMRKELKAAQKELEELRSLKAQVETERRRAEVSKTFEAVGLKPKHATFYPADAEPTPEAVKAWALEHELLSVEEGTEVETPQPSTGFTPTVIPEGRPIGARTYSVQEWKQLAREDPQAAARAHAEGRVNLAVLREGLGPDRFEG